MLRNIALIVLLVFSSLAFAKDKDRPAWVDNPDLEYNNLLYLSAVGTGSSRTQAEDNARANIAKIFSTNVKSESGFEQRYNEIISSSDASSTTTTSQTDKLQISSNQNLVNIQIGKSWTDKMGQVYVVAYLHRSSTAELYLSRIDENCNKVIGLMNRAIETQDIWAKFALLEAAGVVNTKSLEMLDQLKVISLSDADSFRLPYDSEILQEQVELSGKAISFQIDTVTDDDASVGKMVEAVINNMGFAIFPGGLNRISVRYSTEELKLDNPQKYVRYQLSITVFDDHQQQIVTLNESGREAHFTLEEAKARALRTASSKVSGAFAKKMQEYISTRTK